MDTAFEIQSRSGQSGEEFLVIEDRQGIGGIAKESINVREGIGFISVILAQPHDGGLRRAQDVVFRLISPTGELYMGQDIFTVEREGQTVISEWALHLGDAVYLENPTPGTWRLEVQSASETPFTCELRALPLIGLTLGAADENSHSNSFLEFLESLPETQISGALCRRGRETEELVAGDLCHICQGAVLGALVGIGLVALVAALGLALFIGTAALGPIGTAIVGALAIVGIIVIITLVLEVLVGLISQRDNPQIFSLIGYHVCKSAKICM